MQPRLLDASLKEVRRIYPISLSINENAVPLSTATMKLPKGESLPDRSYVELFTPNGSAGVYRTRTPSMGYGSYTNDYQLEHAICEVSDWLVRADIDQTRKTLSAAISQVFSYYGGSKWQLGSVSASGNVILSANYSNVLQTINSLISQVSGAIMTFDFSTTPWKFNVVKLGNTVSAEGRLSRNVASARIRKDDTNLCTRVWLKGLTGGKMDADTIETYGVIEKRLQDKDYTAAQATTVAQSYLNKYKQPSYSVTVDGNDFSSMTGETLDRLSIGKLYRLVIPEDNVTVSEYIVGLNWKDVFNTPSSVTITLSEPNTTLVDYINRQQTDIYGAGGYYCYQEKQKEKVWSKFEVTETQIQAEVGRARESEEEINGRLTRETETIYTRITQTAEAITSEAVRAQSVESSLGSNISKVNTTLSSRITQTAEAITSEVTRATRAEQTINGQLTSSVEELSSRITQTATAIESEVQRAKAAENGKIAKTASYSTVNAIIAEAQEMANAAAVSAKNASIAKTSILQTADAIVTAAVTQSETTAGKTYIAKTVKYQTADAIYSEAKAYALNGDNQLESYINQQADRIDLVVTGSGHNASINVQSIVDGINQSQVSISADRINLHGHVSITDMEEYSGGVLDVYHIRGSKIRLDVMGSVSDGEIACRYVHALTSISTPTLILNGTTVSVQTININGTNYNVLTA